MKKEFSGNQIRQTFIDFFTARGHTVVPSMSLVPGGDDTLLFTNSGMVQFKDVFLGTDKRGYTRVVDSQKCMRVAGKHNDLDDVGRDDTHHTFFEMLGNWSFGDYYKKEAIGWSWELLTEVWGLPKDKLYATCFKDDQGNIPQDDEAADVWKQMPGMEPERILFFGRKENFWQMAATGPCGPCSEIHIDLGEERDNLRGTPHQCGVNGECTRFLELWNNVFIQYNQFEDGRLEPLPAKHVDTGMGFERIVAVLQGVDSNYKTDLFEGALDALAALTRVTREQMYANFTPYRVIADHVRSAAFLIADGVTPGNAKRNYVTRMIIRRAARFGGKIGLNEPFLAKVAEAFIQQYGEHYPELEKNKAAILDNLTREEIRFARTVEAGTAHLENLLAELRAQKQTTLDGRKAFDLYSTYGLPFEISRDIAREQGMDIEQNGFEESKKAHSKASGGGKAMGKLGGEDAEFYAGILRDLQAKKKLGKDGVEYNPYEALQTDGEILALVLDGESVSAAEMDDHVEVILPRNVFYLESGGQVQDTGFIRGNGWEIEVTHVRRPSAGVYALVGEVISGSPKVGDAARAEVNTARRRDIMRNHTATHLLHKALHVVIGEHALQSGSLVAPDYLRFDFNHSQAMTAEEIERVEKMVNEAVAADMPVVKQSKTQEQAKQEGAMALFGEKYGEVVRTISVMENDSKKYSYELCGGTHIDRTSDIGAFFIVSESSASAGIRRIEAVTGRGAYALAAKRMKAVKQTAAALKVGVEDVSIRAQALEDELGEAKKQIAALKAQQALIVFQQALNNVKTVKGVNVLGVEIPGADADALRALADKFREKYPQNGAAILAAQSAVIAVVTEDLVKRGLKAGDLINGVGGKGGGRPNLAQGSLPEDHQGALNKLPKVVEEKIK
ncbi:MAG: alanine--tRNA ligase [Anaerolineales bacterium]